MLVERGAQQVGKIAALRELAVVRKGLSEAIEKATGMSGEFLSKQAIRGNPQVIKSLTQMFERVPVLQAENASLKAANTALRGELSATSAELVAIKGTAEVAPGQIKAIHQVLPQLRSNVSAIDKSFNYGDLDYWIKGFGQMRNAANNALNTVEALAGKAESVAATTARGHKLEALHRVLPELRSNVSAIDKSFHYGDLNYWIKGFGQMRNAPNHALNTIESILR